MSDHFLYQQLSFISHIFDLDKALNRFINLNLSESQKGTFDIFFVFLVQLLNLIFFFSSSQQKENISKTIMEPFSSAYVRLHNLILTILPIMNLILDICFVHFDIKFRKQTNSIFLSSQQ